MMILFLYHPLYVRWNHGLALLSSILGSHGVECKTVALPDDIDKLILEYNPTYIGFSFVNNYDYTLCLPYINQVKAYGIPVMMGGVFSRLSSKVKGDYVCKGEGETLTDFFLNHDTSMFDSTYYHKDLDNLPLPDYTGVTGYEFDRGINYLKGLKIIPYSGSRGCPYPCAFCNVQYQPKGVRFKSTYRQDLKYLHEQFHPDLFLITDELIPYYSDSWCERFKDNMYPFLCYIRADITAEKLLFLIDCGVKLVAFGVESGDEKYRNDVLKKGLSDADIWQTIAILNKYNIAYVPFFMTETPGETVTLKAKTMDMVKKVGGFPIVWKYDNLKEVL